MSKIKSSKQNSKKDYIVKMAAQRFREQGYNACSMRQLAESCGVEAASLYNHIKNKGALLEIICFEMADIFMGQLNQIEAEDQPIRAKLEAIIRHWVRTMVSEFDIVFVANHDWKNLETTALNKYLQQRRLYERRLTELIAKGVDQGELKKVDPFLTMATILSAVRGIELWHRSKKHIAVEQIENHLVTQLLDGLSAN